MTLASDGAADARWQRVLFLSLALLFFALPHSLEDFALGEPVKRGVPGPLIAAVLSALIAVQGLGLYAIGRRDRRGLWLHAVLGGVWPLAAGFAQLGEILQPLPYRAGAISVAYVIGIIIVGLALSLVSLAALRAIRR